MVENCGYSLKAGVLILPRGRIKWGLEIEWVGEEFFSVVVDVSPHAHCLVLQLVLVSLSLVVTEESAEAACVNLVHDEREHSCVELKHCRHLHVNNAN